MPATSSSPTPSSAASAYCEAVGVQAGGVGEVGLEQDVVDADALDRRCESGALEPEAAVHLARKYSDGSIESLSIDRRRALVQLVVERLEEERDPADPALHRHELQRREALEHAGEDQVGDDAARSLRYIIAEPIASLRSSSSDGHGDVPNQLIDVSLAPMWKFTGSRAPRTTSQNGSQCRLAAARAAPCALRVAADVDAAQPVGARTRSTSRDRAARRPTTA